MVLLGVLGIMRVRADALLLASSLTVLFYLGFGFAFFFWQGVRLTVVSLF